MIFKLIDDALAFDGVKLEDRFANLKSGQGILYSLFGGSNQLSKQDIAQFSQLKDLYDAGEIEAYNVALSNMQSTLSQTGKTLANGLADGSVSFEQITASAAASTTSLIGMRVAAVALNTAISVGFAALVQFGASVIYDVIHAQEQLHENVQEVVSDYQTQRDELRNNQTTFDGLVSKYAELSKGVNSLGQNVSLTSEDYDEYHNVANQIGEMIPDMVAGFDSQGNAILKCRDNINELVDAYNKLLSAN